MSEKKKILELLLNQKVSLVMKHGYRSDGIIRSVGDEMLLLIAVNDGQDYFEYIEITSIVNIKLGGKEVKELEDYEYMKLSKVIDEAFKK